MLSGVRLRLRTCRAAFRSESFFSGDPPDSGAGLGVSTSSYASGAADSASGSVAETASGAAPFEIKLNYHLTDEDVKIILAGGRLNLK